MSKPLPKFNLNQPVKLDKKLYDGKEQPIVVGYAWADDDRKSKVKSDTYYYYVKTVPGQEWLRVSEEDLTKWNG